MPRLSRVAPYATFLANRSVAVLEIIFSKRRESRTKYNLCRKSSLDTLQVVADVLAQNGETAVLSRISSNMGTSMK